MANMIPKVYFKNSTYKYLKHFTETTHTIIKIQKKAYKVVVFPPAQEWSETL